MTAAISDHVRAALARRRDELGALAGSETAAVPSDLGGLVAEDALRTLMTGLYPRFAAGRASAEDAARAIALLGSIEAEAGGSLRFLDAFAAYFELAASAALLPAQPGWSSFLAAYRRAIDRFDSDRSFEEELARHGAPWRDFRPALHPDSPAAVRRVLILADHAFSGYRILRQVSAIPGVAARVLVCRNPATRPLRFLAGQLKAFGLCAFRNPLGLAGSILKGRWSLSFRALESESVVGWIRGGRFDVGLHAMGVIYRRPVLDAFGLGILNAHIGFLPPFRGRSVVEWSLIAGAPIGTSVFLIDEGIDTGARMICWLPFGRLPDSVAALRQRLFHSDGENYAAAIRRISEPEFRFATNDVTLGRRYYVMSNLLKGVAEQALSDRRRGGETRVAGPDLTDENAVSAGATLPPFSERVARA